MDDFATLGMGIDSSGLIRGRDELGRLTEAGGRAERGLGGSANKIGAAWKSLARVIGPAVAGLAAALGTRSIIRDAENYELRLRRIQAILKATGGVAGRSSKQLEAQAQSLARASLASVDGIMAAQQTLLTFRNIRGQVFDETIQAALDLSTAMGQDLNSSILQVAKALEDPVRGMTALSRSGTVFTDQQREMVKAMVDAGDTMGAQNFILSELNAQYGGAAEAVPRLSAAQDSLGQSGENARRALNDLLGITDRLAAIVESADSAVQFFTNNIESFAGVAIAASIAIGVQLVPVIWGAVTATYAWVAALVTLKGALIATGVGALIVGAGLLIGQFIKLVQATGSLGAALGLVGNVFKEVFDRMRLSVPLIGDIMYGLGMQIEGAFISAFGVVDQAWRTLVNGMIEGVNGVAKALNAVFKTDFGMAGLIPDSTMGSEGSNRSGLGRELAGSASRELGRFLGSELESVNALKAAIAEANAELTGAGEGAAPVGAGAAMGAMGEAGGEGAGGGGGGLLGGMERLNELLGQFQEQDPRAAIEAWHSEAMAALNDANLIERGMMEEHNAYKLQIEQMYQDQLMALRRQEADQTLGHYQSFFGTMAGALQSGGESMLKISKAFGVAEAIVSMWRGAAKALELPFPANLAAWAQVLATGMKAVQGIKSARPGSSGGAASSGGGAAAGAGAASAQGPRIFLNVQPNARGDIPLETFNSTIDEINRELDRGGQIVA